MRRAAAAGPRAATYPGRRDRSPAARASLAADVAVAAGGPRMPSRSSLRPSPAAVFTSKRGRFRGTVRLMHLRSFPPLLVAAALGAGGALGIAAATGRLGTTTN